MLASFPVSCPSGWTRFNDSCYFVSSLTKTWLQAQAHCHGISGDLVKINSAEENEFVLNLVKTQAPTLQRAVWIGLNWNSTANMFYWNDRSVPVYENWGSGEPNGRAQEPCGEMYISSAYWNDIPCNILLNGIVCKKLL